MGKAATKAQNKYNSKAYDRIYLIVPKGDKEKIKQVADSQQISLNSFINIAIQEKLDRTNM